MRCLAWVLLTVHTGTVIEAASHSLGAFFGGAILYQVWPHVCEADGIRTDTARHCRSATPPSCCSSRSSSAT